MNYLFRYLQLLTNDEAARMRELELAPREREVLQHLLDLRAQSDPVRDCTLETLGISSLHFDKVCSIVLRKVYAAMVPEGGTTLLYDLNRRDLTGNFLHEFRRQERELAKAPAEIRGKFYLDVFNMLGRISRKDYDEKLVRELARKYSRLCPSPDNPIYFEACLIGGVIWKAAARGLDEKAVAEVVRRLAANDRKITPSTGPLALYKQCQAYALHYGQLDLDSAKRLEYLVKAADIARSHPDLITEEEQVLIRCKIAESHYFNSSDFELAYSLYAELFDRHAPVLARDFYHTVKFSQLCIIVGQYERAGNLLDDRFSRHLSSAHASIGTMGAIAWAKLLLTTGRADEAKGYIDFGFQRNRKNFYVQYEIELRLLETAYFMLKKEWEFAARLAEKHIRYLRSKGYTIATSRYYPWYFKLMLAFIEERETGRELPEELAGKLEEFREGAAAVYGILLQLSRARESVMMK